MLKCQYITALTEQNNLFLVRFEMKFFRQKILCKFNHTVTERDKELAMLNRLFKKLYSFRFVKVDISISASNNEKVWDSVCNLIL